MSIHTVRGRSAARLLCAAASAGAISAAMAGQALAQTADVGEVVVTASRIQSAGFTAPTPTTSAAPATTAPPAIATAAG